MVDLFWDNMVDVPYQMGPQKHRLYVLDLLKRKDVTSILDVGCGTGPIYEIIKNTWEATSDLITELPKYNFKYKGVDYSPKFINWAKKEFPEADFEVQNARNLKEKDNSWDCVLLMHALDHIDPYQKVIAEAVRVTKRYVCIILWRSFQIEGRGTHINPINRIGKEPTDKPWDDTFLIDFQKSDLEAEFAKNNLIVEEIAEGEIINEGGKIGNFLFLCRKK